MIGRSLPLRKSHRLLGVLAALAATGAGVPAASAAQDTVSLPERGWIGILPSAPTLERVFRLMVVDVYRDSPAHLEGIVPGDWLIAVDGNRLNTYHAWLRSTSNLHAGQSIRLVVVRNGDQRDVTLVADPAPEFVGPDPLNGLEMAWARMDSLIGGLMTFAPAGEPWLWPAPPDFSFYAEFDVDSGGFTVTFGDPGIVTGGVTTQPREDMGATETEPPPLAGGGGAEMTGAGNGAAEVRRSVFVPRFGGTVVLGGVLVRDLTAEQGSYLGVEKGVLVTDVYPMTPGLHAGFRPGDVIVTIEEKPFESVRDLRRLLLEMPTPIELTVIRRKDSLKITYPRPQG